MIGNDIVDLALAKKESNWRRKGYLDKIFTAHEQHLIDAANNPDQMVWLLWSMKESAYKIIIRDGGKRCFAPRKLGCQLTELNADSAKGFVSYEKSYFTQSCLTSQYVSTITISDNNLAFEHIIVPFSTNHFVQQSSILWDKIKLHCTTQFADVSEKFQFHKDEANVPWIIIFTSSHRSVKIPLSISHHGRFGAFCLIVGSSQSPIGNRNDWRLPIEYC